MFKHALFFMSCFLCGIWAVAQNVPTLQQFKKIKVSDTIIIAPKSIQKEGFKVFDSNNKLVDSTNYTVDFVAAKLYIKEKSIKTDSLSISYINYPDFLTRKYQLLDPSLIVPKNTGALRLYKLKQSNKKVASSLFEGLTTSGSISRGITIGNNQNSVFNSELDLQLSGKLSQDVTLKASLQDSNIPIQQGGFSQSIDEFDQIFIEIQAKNWGVRAGDIQISEQKSIFSAFTKKLQGLSANATLASKKATTTIYAAGALVRGIFNQSNIQAQEGNQGPYKLVAQNGDLSILIVSGSETVYVNGLPRTRGENNDYIIDYNAGEIRFNPTFPITADMRISVEYQTTQSNFARILGHGGASYVSKKLNLQSFVYSESDLRDQSLQQSLSDEQKQVLSEAGDQSERAIVQSAVVDTFSENKTLYFNNGTPENPEFVFAASEEDRQRELFNVRFTEVPQNTGNYILSNANVTNPIFRFVAPENGIPQGNFEPIIQLIAPIKLQLAVLKGNYTPSEKASLNFELAASNNDNNLFSDLDDSDNTGAAIHVDFSQRLWKNKKKSWQIGVASGVDYVDAKFRSIEGLYNIEFNRDWNLDLNFVPENQIFNQNSIQFKHVKKGSITYGLDYLDYENQYQGTKHSLTAGLTHKKWNWIQNTSLLSSDATIFKSSFFRNTTNLNYTRSKFWAGIKFLAEANEEKNKQTQELSSISQRFTSYEVYTGVGDSTNVFTKIGYRFRENDSIQNNQLQKVTTSNTFYVDSKLINNEKTQLSFFVNYRVLDDVRESEADKNLNSRIVYRQRLWKNRLQWNTLLETKSGTIAQQEFTFVEVDPGRGQYIWIDFNNDGIQDLQEFEISPFPDEANFIRVLLPRQEFIRTYQNRFSQQLNWNFSSFKKSKQKWKRWFSHFHNQTSYTIDRNVRRVDNRLNLNVFEDSEDDLGLNSNLRNSLFFNRGKQHFSTTYTYLNTKTNNVLVTGSQKNNLLSNRINFSHKIKESWLFELQLEGSNNESEVADTPNRNFIIEAESLAPNISYLLSSQTTFTLGYELSKRENTLEGSERLSQQNFSTSFRTSSKQKATFTGTFNWFENDFEGDAFSPVSFQILEGLEPGTNFTWSAIAQKKLTKFLELNLNYNGRKSESSKTIHTGSVQLRAFF